MGLTYIVTHICCTIIIHSSISVIEMMSRINRKANIFTILNSAVIRIIAEIFML